jgi:hypothetical protein
MIWNYRVHGVVREKESGAPIARLLIRGFDKDLIWDDDLGHAISDEEGRFEFSFTDEQFRQAFDNHPDIYLRVFDAAGKREILNTKDRIRNNASDDEYFELEIPKARLVAS